MALVAFGALPAQAADFSCRNTNAEISCEAGSCLIDAESFTPMQLSRTGDRLEICAYSGCWEGPIGTTQSAGAVEFLHARVRNSQSSGGDEELGDLSVLFNRSTASAQMSWGGYANVMGCGETHGGS